MNDTQFLLRTCWALCRDGPSVKGGAVLGDGPHLAGGPHGDGLERLVGPHVEPRGSLSEQREDVRTTDSS